MALRSEIFRCESSKTFTVAYTVKEDDLGKTLVNVATAQADPVDGHKPTGEDTTDGEKVEDPRNSLKVTKTVLNRKDLYKVGDTIYYEITVKNTGNTTQRNLTLEDRLINSNGQVTFTSIGSGYWIGSEVHLDSLASGDTWILYCQYTVRTADEGKKITNSATVDSDNNPGGETGETDGVDVEQRYSLTIHYVDTDGNPVAASYYGRFAEGEHFRVVSPALYWYETDIHVITSGEKGMPAKDLEYTVIYRRNDEPEEPGPGPDEEEPDEEPDDQPEETQPEEPEETQVYEVDPDTYELTPITEEETPLANVDAGEHTCCIMHFLLMLAAMVVLGFYTKSRKKHQARIFEMKTILAMEGEPTEEDGDSQES